MTKIIIYSLLLVCGVIYAQIFGDIDSQWVKILMMFCMSFIMIHVGYEYEMNKRWSREIAIDYFIAWLTATIPWILCAAYFLWILKIDSWQDALLISRFASPTSTAILLSMLGSVGLGATWLFRKARTLSIFDDLYAIILMIPLKIIAFGTKWQLFVIGLVIAALLWCGWRNFRKLRIPVSWPWVMFYSFLITAFFETIHLVNNGVGDLLPVNLEIFLPAFIMGCVLARPKGQDPHLDDARIGHLEGPEDSNDQFVSGVITAVFMFLVGLSMPAIPLDQIGWGIISLHVFMITVLSNFGKMTPLFFYKKEASFKERLALSIAMFPRGEAGGRNLVKSIGYGASGLALNVAVISLTLNLLLTGLFITAVKKISEEH